LQAGPKKKLGFATEGSGHWIVVWPKGSNAKFHLCEGKLEPGNTGISLYCESVENTVATLEKKGVKFATPVTKEWGTFTTIADPDGNAIWLSEGGP
jgi:predicted enzyme related to lactoylglutathione lyase